MAYTWYYSSAYNFGGYKEYRAWLGLDVSSSATTTTVKWSIGVQMKYGSQWGVAVSLSGAASGSCEGYLSSSPGGSWKDVCRKDGSVSFTRGHSAASKSFTSKAYGKTVSGYGSAGGSISVTKSVTVPAKASYTVSYNANGGSGAPGSQTKWYNETLTLSTAKPTRTGYTFAGWYTAASGGSKYGTTYTGNAAATLYAHWTPITYTVSYNANGGSGVPANQTKTYGVNLTLTSLTSSQLPVRKYYKFMGWATSATGAVAYQPGGTYTGNGALVLYAVWQDNSYTVEYNANLPEGKELSGDPPAKVRYDKGQLNDKDVSCRVDNGSSFVISDNSYHIIGFTWQGVDVALGDTITPAVGESVVLVAKWIANYADSELTQFKSNRYDIYGDVSIAGKTWTLSFTAVPARGTNGHTDNVFGPYDTSFNVEYSADGETWVKTTKTIPSSINTNYSFSESFNDIDETGYKWYRITLQDTDAIEHSGDEEKVVPAPIIQAIPQIPDSTDSRWSSIRQEARIVDNTLTYSRETISSSTINFGFQWIPYYDGNKRYVEKVEFTFTAIPYEIVEGKNNYSEPITITRTYNYSSAGRDWPFVLNESFTNNEEEHNKGIDVDKNAEVYLTKVVSSCDIGTTKEKTWEYTPNLKIFTVNLGGFPIHINEDGSGISLFGLANNLIGFEVNRPTILNNTLEVKNLALGQPMTLNEVQTFLNSLNIVPGTPKKMEEADWIVEQGYEGIWFWRKWNSGIAECWGITAVKTYACTAQSGNLWYTSDTFNFPTNLFTQIIAGFSNRVRGTGSTPSNALVTISGRFLSTTTFSVWVYTPQSTSQSLSICLFAKGRWK